MGNRNHGSPGDHGLSESCACLTINLPGGLNFDLKSVCIRVFLRVVAKALCCRVRLQLPTSIISPSLSVCSVQSVVLISESRLIQ